LIRDNNIENLIISGPPHSMQLAGLWLKKKFGSKINLIVDYRDSWNSRKAFRKNIPILQSLNEYIERKILRGAESITNVSSVAINDLRKMNKDLVSKQMLLIRNGYDEDLEHSFSDSKLNNIEIKDEEKNMTLIGHFGSLKPLLRDPKNIIDAIFKIKENEKDLSKKLKLLFYGQTPKAIKVYTEKILGNTVEFRDVIQYKEAIEEMRKMDYLLLFSTDH